MKSYALSSDMKIQNVFFHVYSKGGLKAVMWTDAFQMIIVFAGLMTLIIKATIEVGGIAKVFEKASAGGKLEIDK